ncbi:MAG TPA: two-component regulator propeller domain-containing protein [Candidatus Limnocylindria bacterium]|nr:two-component regulator propeller domain-containing protein [Candidatus Limnocylindria bacterium]
MLIWRTGGWRLRPRNRFFGRLQRFVLASVGLLLGLLGHSQAAEYLIDVWQTDDGLPQNSVTSVAQGRDGYLWIGTQDGLVRFDGLRFQVFDANNTPAIKNSRIVQLFNDRQGTLWVGTEQAGLMQFRDGQFRAFNPPNMGTTHNYARVFGDDEGGAFWMVSCEWELIRWQEGSFTVPSTRWNLAGAETYSLASAPAGGLWVGTDRELAIAHGDQFEIVWDGRNEPGFRVDVLAPSRKGGCWVAARNRLRQFQTTGPTADLGSYAWTNRPVYALHEDSRGYLWVATLGSGLYRYDTNGTVLHLGVSDGLPTDFIRCVTEDHEGNLWVGTEGGGLCRLKPTIFQTYGRKQGLCSDQVTSVHQSASGDMWIGTNGDGVDRLNPDGISHFGVEQGLGNGHVWAVLQDRQGSVWAGTWGGLFRMDHDRFAGLSDGVHISWQVLALHEDRKGTLWLGQQALGGISRLTGNQSDLLKLSGAAADLDVRTIVESPDGAVWIGSNGDGLYRLLGDKVTRYGKRDGLGSEMIWCLYPDQDGAVWIGTYRGGLGRWKDGQLKTISSRDGLVNDVISQILEDDQGYLWFGSHGGVFRIAKEELNRFADGKTRLFHTTSYGKADGLPSVECSGGSQPAACKSRDGRLWFPTVKGLAVVDPRTIVRNTLAPPVVIESLSVDGRVTEITENSLSLPGPIRIKPGAQRFEIRYTGLSYTAPQKVRFRYKLEGLEDEWLEAGTQRTAGYSFLKPGGYHFRVTACNNDGVWNDTAARLDFEVLPHFWQTGWFFLLVVLAGLGMIVGVVRWIEQRKLRQQVEKLERERMVERERSRIARDIHDDLGSSLTRIALLSELATADKERPLEVEAHALKIAASARETVRSLDEIVWAVNPQNDTLNSLSDYLSHYATEFFEGSPVSCRFELPDASADLPLASETRHQLFLAVKEALHNVLKHAQAKETWIRMTLAKPHLEIVVQDDGCGFDITAHKGSPGADGLGNMAKRVKDLGGQMNIKSATGQGTVVTFVVPLANGTSKPATTK